MILLPAVDMIGLQAVRLRQGDFSQQSDYGSPLTLAMTYAKAGASHLHLVDLDAARTGESHQDTRALVATIIAETGLQVELGGGIRTPEQVADWLSLGVWRCVLGTAAIRDHAFARAMAHTWGERVAIGIDARNGYVATGGWLQTEAVSAVEVACIMRELGFQDCIYTDISKDGMLGGANVADAVALAERSGLQVVVSGGVCDLQDIAAALASRHRGISGIIAGKSLIEGTLVLQDALALVRNTLQKQEVAP